MNTKKKVTVVILIIFACLFGALVYLFLSDPAEAEVIAAEKIVPMVTLAAGTALTIFSLLYPVIIRTETVIGKTLSSGQQFENARSELAFGNEQNSARYEALKKEIALLVASLEELRTGERDRAQREKKIIQILLVAFGNDEEMVRRGLAREIFQIAEENAETEETDVSEDEENET